MFAANRKYLYTAIAVVVLFAVFAWIFYRRGKKQVTLQYLPGELPGNPGSGNVSGASNDEIKNLANELYRDMKGLNVLGHDMDVYRRALLLSDPDLVKLYNAFNSQYQANSGETLTAWLESEAFSSTFEREASVLQDRLKKLNSQ